MVTDFDSKNPDQGFPVLMIGYEQAPAAIVFLKSSNITEPKQLEGKTLGAAANDGVQAVPDLRRHAGIDASKVEIQFIDPKLRETLLARKEVDAISGRFSTRCSS